MLGELEAGSCVLYSGLFSFFYLRVLCQEVGRFEDVSEFLVVFVECAVDAVFDCIGCSCQTIVLYGTVDVESIQCIG